MKTIFDSAKYSDVPDDVRSDIDKLLNTKINADSYGRSYVIDIGSKKASMFIHGPTGSGKTHILHAIKHRVDEEIGTYAMSIIDYVDIQFMDQKEILEVGEDPHIVAIDDLGARAPSEFSTDVLYRLLDARYQRMLPTIITSNLSIDKVAEIFGDRISSRIDRMAVIHEVS